MKKFQKVLGAVLSAAIVLTFAGCGENAESKPQTSSSQTESSSSTSTSSEASSSSTSTTSSSSAEQSSSSASTSSSLSSASSSSSISSKPANSTSSSKPTEPVNVPEASPDDFEYAYTDSGEIKITKFNGEATSVKIPNEIDGLVVREIDSKAISYNKKVTNIIIPDSATKCWFQKCGSLKNVTIPNGVTSVNFYECPSLTSVTIPNSVTTIGTGAFSKCSSLKSVTIPDSVSSIYHAFAGCTAKITYKGKVYFPSTYNDLDKAINGR